MENVKENNTKKENVIVNKVKKVGKWFKDHKAIFTHVGCVIGGVLCGMAVVKKGLCDDIQIPSLMPNDADSVNDVDSLNVAQEQPNM